MRHGARLYGRALKNERIYGYVPDARFKRTSIISTVRLNGDSVPFMFKGTLDGGLFIGYIEQFLAPTLKEGGILVLDSCPAHKKHQLDAVYEQGASVWFCQDIALILIPVKMLGRRRRQLF